MSPVVCPFGNGVCVFVCVLYRRTEVTGGSPGLEGIRGGGDPMPISGS